MNAGRRAITAVLAGAVALVGCSEDGPTAMPMQPIEASEAVTVLAEGGSWVLEYVAQQDCVRLRSGDDGTFCGPSISGGGLSGGLVSGGDGRYVVYSVGTPNCRAKLFSSTAAGVPMVTATMGEVTWAIAELADGEIPWGVQIVDATGALVLASSLLG